MRDWDDLAFQADCQVRALHDEAQMFAEPRRREGDTAIFETLEGTELRIEIAPIRRLLDALSAIPEAKP